MAVKRCGEDKYTLNPDGSCPNEANHAKDPEVNTELDRQIIRAQAAQVTAQRLARGAKAELAAVQETLDFALRELNVYAQVSRDKPEWMMAQQKRMTRQHYATLLALFSDLHAGEVVNPDEIDGYNKFNLKVAEMRTERFFRRTIHLSRNYLSGVHYDGIVLALLGDLISGNIHDELVQTNECSNEEAVYIVVPWLVKGIEMWAEEFKQVHVVSAPGNHGRNSLKPRHKKRSQNNADSLIARLVARDMASADNITFNIPVSSDVGWTMYNWVFAGEHGDNLHGFSGATEIGALGPVKRGTGRQSRQAQELGKPFKYSVVGHFHQFVPAYTQGFIMNGSVKGFDEYAKDGKYSPEIAQQGLLVVTPERGVSTATSVEVADRDEEGW